MNNRQLLLFSLVFIFTLVVMTPKVSAQDVMDQRITAIEKYLESFQPTLADFSDRLQHSIQDYTTQLEASLSDFSNNLQSDVEQRLLTVNNRITVLNPTVKAFQRIDTNTGTFLIAVDKVETITNGYRMTLNIGNPNYADYRDFSVQVFWGEKWDPNGAVAYERWRSSLKGAEYSFQGLLKKGEWQQIEIDLVPADRNSINYLECKMTVLSVELRQSQ